MGGALVFGGASGNFRVAWGFSALQPAPTRSILVGSDSHDPAQKNTIVWCLFGSGVRWNDCLLSFISVLLSVSGGE